MSALSNGTTMERIGAEFDELLPEDQLRLLDMLVHRIMRTQDSKRTRDLAQYYGIAKGLWDQDAQEYVSGLREDRA